MSEEKTFFEKNMEVWERWTGTYMDGMFKAMEKTMEQSVALQKQMEKAAAVAVGAQMDAALTAIRGLEKQVETLAAKVDELLRQEEN